MIPSRHGGSFETSAPGAIERVSNLLRKHGFAAGCRALTQESRPPIREAPHVADETPC